jgi:DNA-3-methyladenine glycosylase I
MSNAADLQLGSDGRTRCWWCGHDPLYVSYHDDEWGMPVDDDRRLFEKICLEGFQAGLSWITILRRREAFRANFCGFDFQRVARFDDRHVERLVTDAAIIRHRGKIESVVNNARRALELIEERGSLAAFLWHFEPERPTPREHRDQIESKTAESIEISRQLKRRGWSFVGPTTCYAMMQAVGMVNDHLQACHAWAAVEQARNRFQRPR